MNSFMIETFFVVKLQKVSKPLLSFPLFASSSLPHAVNTKIRAARLMIPVKSA